MCQLNLKRKTVTFKPGDKVRCTLSPEWKGYVFEVASLPWTTNTGAEMIAIVKPCYPWNLGMPMGMEVPVNHIEHISAKTI